MNTILPFLSLSSSFENISPVILLTIISSMIIQNIEIFLNSLSVSKISSLKTLEYLFEALISFWIFEIRFSMRFFSSLPVFGKLGDDSIIPKVLRNFWVVRLYCLNLSWLHLSFSPHCCPHFEWYLPLHTPKISLVPQTSCIFFHCSTFFCLLQIFINLLSLLLGLVCIVLKRKYH